MLLREPSEKFLSVDS